MIFLTMLLNLLFDGGREKDVIKKTKKSRFFKRDREIIHIKTITKTLSD